MLLKSTAIKTTTRATTRAALATLFALPCFAFAQAQAYINQPVNLMAGPDDSYPVVAGLAPNQPVTVMGCISDYTWCDVALDDLRGWIYGDALNYPYEGNYVPLESYGAVIGLPLVVFSIDSYWGRYYQSRPWYGERDRWRNAAPHGNERAHPPSNGYGGHPPPMQGQTQPAYRPQTSPLPPRGPQGQPQQEYGHPPVQAQPQPQYGHPPVQAQPQPQYSHPPVQGQPQPQYSHPPVQAQPQPQYSHPPVQAQPQPQYNRPQAQPQGRTAPPAQPQGRGGEQSQGHREPPQN
jgi:uncharacterized protein YraI